MSLKKTLTTKRSMAYQILKKVHRSLIYSFTKSQFKNVKPGTTIHTVQMINTAMKMSTARTLTNVSMEYTRVVKMPSAKIQRVITHAVAKKDSTVTASIALILMSAAREIYT